MKQLSFTTAEHDLKKKKTRREQFLSEMDQVIPWSRLIALIEPFYPKAVMMLRIYFLQQWYSLSDPAAEESLYDMESMRRFVGIVLHEDSIPDETTILNFRHWLEKHNLTEAVFEDVRHYMDEKGLFLKQGTIVDASMIAASPSTKNKAHQRDKAMSQTKKGNQWYFGMKCHIGVDADTGLVHTIKTSTAKTHDSKLLDDLLITWRRRGCLWR